MNSSNIAMLSNGRLIWQSQSYEFQYRINFLNYNEQVLTMYSFFEGEVHYNGTDIINLTDDERFILGLNEPLYFLNDEIKTLNSVQVKKNSPIISIYFNRINDERLSTIEEMIYE